jgi:hypothetical protein
VCHLAAPPGFPASLGVLSSRVDPRIHLRHSTVRLFDPSIHAELRITIEPSTRLHSLGRCGSGDLLIL